MRFTEIYNTDFGVISEIERAIFELLVIYILGGKIWGSDTNFRGKFWGQAPRLPDMEVPHSMGVISSIKDSVSNWLVQCVV